MPTNAIRKIIKFCERNGARVEYSKHLKIFLPNGKLVVCSRTPSDRNGARNCVRDIEKAGLDVKELKY